MHCLESKFRNLRPKNHEATQGFKMSWGSQRPVRVVPLPVQQGLKFDLILPDGYVVTISMDEYEVRAYRGSVSDVIYAKVIDWLENNDYPTTNVQVIFC